MSGTGSPILSSSGVMRKRNNPYEPAPRVASPTSPSQRPDAPQYNLSNSSFNGVGVNGSFINHLISANSPNASRSNRGGPTAGDGPLSIADRQGGGFSHSHARAPSGNQHFNQSLGQRPPSRQASYVGPAPEFSFTPLLGANATLGNDSFNFDPVFGSFAEHPDAHANTNQHGPAMSESFAMRPEMGSGRAGTQRQAPSGHGGRRYDSGSRWGGPNNNSMAGNVPQMGTNHGSQ